VRASVEAIEARGGLLGCRPDEENSGYDERQRVTRSVFKRESPLTLLHPVVIRRYCCGGCASWPSLGVAA
jgi:hypothetical protein